MSVSIAMATLFQTKSQTQPVAKAASCPWLKRLGIVGFLFFLIKGLLWLTVPVAIYFFGTN